MNFELDQALTLLHRTPAALRALLIDLPREFVNSDGDPENWRPFDVVGPMIEGERTDWLPRAQIILEEGEERPFEPFDRYAQFDRNAGKVLEELLDEFGELRRQNLEILASWDLSAEDLQKSGRHPEFGRVTLEQLLSTWVVHDLSHLAQIARAMAEVYSEQVGPWQAYLPILHR